MTVSEKADGAPGSPEAIDAAIGQFTEAWCFGNVLRGLVFAPALEADYQSDTKAGRVREIRVTCIIALAFYYATVATDPIFVPDLGWNGLFLRLLLLPLVIFLLIAAPQFTAPMRELLLTIMAFAALALLTCVSALSVSPYAPYAIATVCWALVYANTTFPLRFNMACACTGMSCVGLIAAAFVSPQLTPALAVGIGLQVVIVGLFSLMANYRIERSARLAYLLAARESVRLRVLAVERETFAALSILDGLTGLFNRGHLDRHLSQLFPARRLHGLSLGLLMIDVDHFKGYNDRYGHGAGDTCLRAIAAVIASASRDEHDLAVRYGGEEFLVFLPSITASQTEVIAHRVRGLVAARLLPHANRLDDLAMVTISVGVAHAVVWDGAAVEALLAKADRALYGAKRKGRNRVENDSAVSEADAEIVGVPLSRCGIVCADGVTALEDDRSIA